MPVPAEQKVMAVLWPSFLAAGVATVLFFAAFDPDELLAGTSLSGIDRTSVYSVGFLLFWLLTATACALTVYFLAPIERGGEREEPE